MTGDAALAYVRSRHYQYQENGRWKEDGSSDRGRIRRQQDFIKRMLRKAIDRGATRPDVAKKLIDTALKNVRIDEALTVNDLLTVAEPPPLVRPERGQDVPDGREGHERSAVHP